MSPLAAGGLVVMAGRALSSQCTATSKQTGKRCGQMVIGGGVCRWHGGAAPQTNRNRERKLALAEALAADPHRHPAEVLGDVAHQFDWLMRRARDEVKAGELTAETMTALVDAAERAGRWSKELLAAGTDERQTKALEVAALTQIVDVVQRAVVAEVADASMRDRITERIRLGLRGLSGRAELKEIEG